MEDDFEDWKRWFDSHKEPDGKIILGKHPELCIYLTMMFNHPTLSMNKLNNIEGLGETVNFDLTNIKKSWED